MHVLWLVILLSFYNWLSLTLCLRHYFKAKMCFDLGSTDINRNGEKKDIEGRDRREHFRIVSRAELFYFS